MKDEDIVCTISNNGIMCIASWGWRSSQGFGCSPIKAVRELGSERRETVGSLANISQKRDHAVLKSSQMLETLEVSFRSEACESHTTKW